MLKSNKNNILKANCYKKRKLKNQSKGQEQIQVQILTQKALRINFKICKSISSDNSTNHFSLITIHFIPIVNNFTFLNLKYLITFVFTWVITQMIY